VKLFATALFALAIAALVGGAAARAQGLASERSMVTIALAERTVLDDTVVYLDQIAKLSGGPVSLRQRIARLDVAEFRLHADRTVISSDQVKYRLLLAGISEAQIQFIGAKRTMVTASDEPLTVRKVLGVADEMVRARYPNAGPSKDVILPALQTNASDRVQLEAKPPVPLPRNQGTRVDVMIHINGQPREIVSVNFEPEPKSALPPIYDTNVKPAQRLVTKEKVEPLIRTRDLVKIVVPIGNAQLTATGEAQQDGKLGDIIRVRNVDSNRIVNGRVEAAGIVIAEY